MALTSWDMIYLHKVCGGLGIRNIQLNNKDLMNKVGQDILFNDKYWCEIMKDKYLNNYQFFKNLSNSLHPRGFIIWNNILKSKKLILLSLRQELGNGYMIRFWEETWVIEQPLNQSIFKDLLGPDISLFERIFFNYFFENFGTRQWRKIENYCYNNKKLIQKTNTLQKTLKLTRIPFFQKEDGFNYANGKRGKFNIKSTCSLLLTNNHCNRFWNNI